MNALHRWYAPRRLIFEVPFLGLIPIAICAVGVFAARPLWGLGWDFKFAFYPAAQDLLDGSSPFPAPGDPSLEGQYAYVYPPLLGYLVTPFTVVTADLARFVAIAALALSLIAALRVLGVRDWRCYTIAFLWAPVYDGLWTATVSIALAFVLSLVWAHRDSKIRFGVTLGLSIAVKLFLAPLLVWPLATRGWRTVAMTVGVVALLVLVPWAFIGFEDLTRYPGLLRELADLEQTEGYSVVAALTALDVGVGTARGIAFALGGALVVAAFFTGRRGDDLASFMLALFACLALSPIAWQHYWVLLLVPLAAVKPTFSAVWLLPVLPYVGLFRRIDADARALSVAIAALTCVAIYAMHYAHERRRDPEGSSLHLRASGALNSGSR